MRLPPGFRFHPTDEELIVYYLKRKLMGKKLMFDAVTEINIYKYAPSDLPDKCLLGSRDLEWYFFCPREKKYACGARLNRATENGYWKMTGKSKGVKYNGRDVGTRQTLIFHEGHAPNGNRTDWVMHEYKLKDQSLLDVVQDAYVLCKIFQKSGPGPMNGAQYGAPFNEEEWSDMEDFTCQIFSNSAPPSNNINDSNAVSLSVPADSLVNFIPTTNLCMDGAQNIDMDLSIKEIGVESSAADPNGLPNYVSPAIIRSSGAMCMTTPTNSYISSPKSLVNDMPGYPSNSDEDILALINLFTEDTNMPPVENNITQFEMNGHLPCLDENNIYNDLADLNWIELRDTQFNLSTAQDAAYSSNQVVMFDDAPYFELNDLSTPLRCHSETGELDRVQSGTICADETFGDNTCFVETLSGWNDHSALLDGSHLVGNNIEELGKDNLIGDSGAHGSHAATSNEVPVLIAQPENGSIAEQMKRKGEPQSNFQLLLEYLFNHMIRAEQLICSIPHYSSSIHFKAEVTLKVGECTKDALLLYMEEYAFILISRGNQPVGDVIIKRSTVAICFLFGCSWLKFGSCHILCCHASSILILHFLSFLVFYFIICMLYDHILVILLNKLIANHQAASLPMVFKFSVFFITIYIFKIASPHSLVFING